MIRHAARAAKERNAPLFELMASALSDLPQASREQWLEHEEKQSFDFLSEFIPLLDAGQTPNADWLFAQMIKHRAQLEGLDSAALSASAQSLIQKIPELCQNPPTRVVGALNGYVLENQSASNRYISPDRRMDEEVDTFRPLSPEPLARPFTDSTSGNHVYTHLRTPVYISYALQNVLEQTWTSCSLLTTPPASLQDIHPKADASLDFLLNKHKDLIHLGPILASKPETFLHFLLQASLEQVFASLEAIKADSAREDIKPESNGDSAMLDASGLSSRSEHEKLASRLTTTGWKEMLWLLGGLVSCLRYWKWLSDDTEWATHWKWPSTLSTSLGLMQTHYSSELGDLDDTVRLGSDVNLQVSTMELLCLRLLERGLINADEAATIGYPDLKPRSQVDLEEVLPQMAPALSPRHVNQLLKSPSTWPTLNQHVRNNLQIYWTAPSPLLGLLSEDFLLLQIACLEQGPQAMLENVVQAMESDEIKNAIANDPHAALTSYGSLVILAISICSRYDLCLPESLQTTSRVRLVDELTDDESLWLKVWIQAKFGSTGISDELLQSTQPLNLLNLAPTLVSQAISAAMAQLIDIETLHSGLSYFSQPLLSWSQCGIIEWLCHEIQRQGVFASIYLDTLQLLVGSDELPRPILERISGQVLHLFEPGNGLDLVIQSTNIDVDKLGARLLAAQRATGRPVIKARTNDWALLLQSRLQSCAPDIPLILDQAVRCLGGDMCTRYLIENLYGEPYGEKTFSVLYLSMSERASLLNIQDVLRGSVLMQDVELQTQVMAFVARCARLLVRFTATPSAPDHAGDVEFERAIVETLSGLPHGTKSVKQSRKLDSQADVVV